MAHHDTAVALLSFAAIALALTACAPPPPSDPTVALRETATDTEADPEPDVPDPAQVAATRPVGPLTWIASEPAAVAQSKAERRPLLINFGTEWCAACKRMAQETFRDPRVQKQAGRFVALGIDATNEDDPHINDVLAKYEVIGVPTLILFDSKGHEQRRITDFIPADRLLTEIDSVR